MTLRSKVIRPAPKPSWAASRALACPARASPTCPRAWLSRVVNRACGTASRENGSANVRRGQSANPQMKRRTVSRITNPGQQVEVPQPALVTVVDSVREAAAVRTCGAARTASRHHFDHAERGRNCLDLHFADPLEHQ